MRKPTLAALLLTSLACAGAPGSSDDATVTAAAASRSTGLEAMTVTSHGSPRPGLDWLAAEDLDARTAEVVQTAAAVWGAPTLDTAGVTIAYTEALVDCDGVRAVGCTTGRAGQGWAVSIFAPGAPCVEATTLPHEVGHLVLGGDAAHADPRWRDRGFWDGMATALSAGIAAADPACMAFLERPDGVFFVDGKL